MGQLKRGPVEGVQGGRLEGGIDGGLMGTKLFSSAVVKAQRGLAVVKANSREIIAHRDA